MAVDKENVRQRVLSYSQVCHLEQVVGNEIQIDGKGPYPALTLTAGSLIETVRDRLNEAGLPVNDIRINGSAASCVVAGDTQRPYNDLDVLFNLRTSESSKDDHTRHDRIRSAALSALLDFFPDDFKLQRPTTEVLSEAYVHKMVKIDNSVDRWSLISIQNRSGPNIELKFVDSMRRQYQFSIDSFQVIIDSFLLYKEASPIKMNERFFPTVVAQTFYGNFYDALDHLKQKIIMTRNPEEIRGGGLLKYSSLLACGYKLSKEINTPTFEKYVCARFFIDFPTIELQRIQLQNYLMNHFAGDDNRKGLFLILTLNVIQRSAFCLSAHERNQTLLLIHHMAIGVTFTPEVRAYNKQWEMMMFDQSADSPPTRAHRPSAPFVAPPGWPVSSSVPRMMGSMHMPSQVMNGMYAPLYVCPVYYSNPVIIPNSNGNTFA